MPDASALQHDMGAEVPARHTDAAIAALAGRQHGVVSRRQLTALGFGRRAIGHRLQCGRLHAVHRGVYSVGHSSLSRQGRWMAAVLAGGADAILSHRSAAAHWGMRPGESGAAVEISAPRELKSRPGLRFHRSSPAIDETTALEGIPVTTASRTLLDLASVLPPHKLERAIDQAEVLRIADCLPLAELISRHPGRAGVAALRAIVDAGRTGLTMTRSDLEDRFLAILTAHRLPRPEVNVSFELAGAWIEVDCLWRSTRVVVELDGFASHGTRAAFERDRVRDRRLQAAGWRVLRVTWRDVHGDSAALAAQLRTLIGSDGGIPSDGA